MRLNVPIAIAASYLVCSGLALPTFDDQKPFLSKGNGVNAIADFQLKDSPNQHYDGHQVIAINATNEQALSALYALRERLALDFWTPLSLDKPIQIRINPEQKDQFFDLLPSSTNYSVAIPDLQQFLDNQAKLNYETTVIRKGFENFFTDYHSYEDITAHLDELASQHKKLVKKIKIGTTSEGRPIYAWRLHKKAKKSKPTKKPKKKTHGKNLLSSWLEDLDLYEDEEDDYQVTKKKKQKKPKKPMEIVINGGQHGREWISPAVVSYMMAAMLDSYDSDKTTHRLLKYFKWTFIPVLNVDGYEYSQTNDRMWRKTRQSFENSKCIGVDLNRNWDFEWESRPGYDSNPCSETYVGTYPFSAPESQALASYIASRKRVISYLDLHSFSQMWMTPYGSDCRHEPKDNEDIIEAALHAVKSLKRVHDKQFEIAPVCRSVSETSGDAIEWSYTKQHVKYSYEIQLRDTGSYGFLLPPSEILPSGEEMLSAIQNLALFIRSRDGKGKKGT
ncbi:hypothetical protein K450DRAFT_233083 [Umbelopsis ramanniana AG]|uniref:Carboxypeptidase M14A n=1 Tax=Umbelopsis ramanniana AG TaxID=1314678 RepID=A0AAD5EE96_UMBRA|nr:uncharacterized protein K450DRAFT_233083 [Umbelopsis ramanniana AG]KAI8581435.1 hypothetical protein K450DRAFT_233083 [Umbelopsis ramanniana AG]